MDHASPPGLEDPRILSNVLRVAWMAVLLGLLVEATLLTIKIAFGLQSAIGRFGADVMAKITWSVLICAGLAVGVIISRVATGPVPVMPAALAGLISAPAATIAARATHKSILEAMGFAAPGAWNAVIVLSGIRAVEYCFLGVILCVLARRAVRSPLAYAGLGLLFGLVFGAATLWTSMAMTKVELPAAEIVTRLVNEAIFPVGCSIVLYVAVVIGKSKADSFEVGSVSG